MEQEPKHYTREPWWVVLVGGVAVPVVMLWKGPDKLVQMHYKFPDRSIAGMMFMGMMGGMLGAGILVARTHVRDVFWCNVVLWVGILLGGVGASLLIAWCS